MSVPYSEGKNRTMLGVSDAHLILCDESDKDNYVSEEARGEDVTRRVMETLTVGSAFQLRLVQHMK